MIKKFTNLFCFCWLIVSQSLGQTGSIDGKVFEMDSNKPLDGAVVYLESEKFTDFTVTNINGDFHFDELRIDSYRLSFSHLAYKNDTLLLDFRKEEPNVELMVHLLLESKSMVEVEVIAESFREVVETPLSIRSLGQVEIQKNPGSGSDIGKVMQILPGVVTTTSFRNDLIIRGGAPSENSFYVDGIRIPVINHLATQGASGGAISLLNADFIRKAELISGSFPANRSNALSSVFHFDLLDGSKVSPTYRVSLGATNISLDAYGILNEKTSFISSIRRSYRQHILKLLGLAVYPIYNDALFKFKIRPTQNFEIAILGLGAVDKFRINEDINNSEIQSYLVENLPVNDQWNYTLGAHSKWFTKKGILSVVASRSQLFNKASRNNINAGIEELDLKYESTEINNRLATEYVYSNDWASFRIGAELTQRQADFDVLNLSYDTKGPVKTEYVSSIDYLMYGAHLQFSTSLIPDYWDISIGLRIDGSNYSPQLENPNKQTSPRLSTTFKISDQLSFNGGFGTYFQLPGDVSLAYAENGMLINQPFVKYIRSSQYVMGISYELPWFSRFTAEVFHKKYANYPFNTRENISQANEGGEYGVSGNSPILSEGLGRSKGLEIMYEQRRFKNWYGTLSYTFSQSEFENSQGELVSSSWDARHILNLVFGRQLKRNWQIGMNIRYQSALPYTPFDVLTSSFVAAWDVNREGIRDYRLLNSQRGKATLLADFRVDKKWTRSWGAVTFYVDIENILADADSQQVLVFDKTNSEGNLVDSPAIENPDDPISAQRYKLKELQNAEGVLIPTFGFIVNF